MITGIPDQPISFVASLTQGCECDGPPSFIAPSDEVRFQIGQTVCDGAENLLPFYFDDWTGDGAWNFLDSYQQACIGLGNNGATITYTGFTPTIGIPYRLTIPTLDWEFSSVVIRVGGATFTLNGPGPYDLFFIASNTSPIEITVRNDNARGCIGVPAIYQLETDLSVRFMDGTTELFEVTMEEEPQYFQFLDGVVSFFMPLTASSITEGCFHIEVEEGCGEGILTSQVFKLVDDDDCGFVVVRACNDYDTPGMPFKVPFAPRIRIPASFAFPKYEYDTFEERHSNGRNYRPYADRERIMTLGTKPLNEDDISFLSALPVFSHVYVGEQEVFVQADGLEPGYTDVWSASGALEIPMKFKQDILRNVQCDTELDGCSPLSDPICNTPLFTVTFPPRLRIINAGTDLVNGLWTEFIPGQWTKDDNPDLRLSFLPDDGGLWLIQDIVLAIGYYGNYTSTGGVIVPLEELTTPWVNTTPFTGDDPMPELTFCEGSYAKVQVLSTLGFTPGNISVNDGTPEPVGTLPAMFNYGPFPNGTEVTITITEANIPTCTYVESFTVPGEACPFDPGPSMIVADAGSSEVNGTYENVPFITPLGAEEPDYGYPIYQKGDFYIYHANGDRWNISDIVNDQGYYYVMSMDATPDLAGTWINGGSADDPVPTVTEE